MHCAHLKVDPLYQSKKHQTKKKSMHSISLWIFFINTLVKKLYLRLNTLFWLLRKSHLPCQCIICMANQQHSFLSSLTSLALFCTVPDFHKQVKVTKIFIRIHRWIIMCNFLAINFSHDWNVLNIRYTKMTSFWEHASSIYSYYFVVVHSLSIYIYILVVPSI